MHGQGYRSVTINDGFYLRAQRRFRYRTRMEIQRLLRVRCTPRRCAPSYILRPRGIRSPMLANSRMRPWRQRRDRDHLRALRRVPEEPRLVNARRRNRRQMPGRLLMKSSAALQGFQRRRGSLHQRTHIEVGPQCGRVLAPSATAATPLVLFVPGLAMYALHIRQFLEAVLPAAATIGFLTVPLEY